MVSTSAHAHVATLSGLSRVEPAQRRLSDDAPASRPIGSSRLLRRPVLVDAALLTPILFAITLAVPLGSISPMIVAGVATAVVTGVARKLGAYTVASNDSFMISWKRSVAAIAVAVGGFLLVAYATNVVHDRSWLPLATAGALVGVSLHRMMLAVLSFSPKTAARFGTRIALIGDAQAIAEFDKLEHKNPRQNVVARTNLDAFDDIRPALRLVDELIAQVRGRKIDRIVVLATAPGIPVVNAVVRRCTMHGVGVDLLTGAAQVRPSRLEMGSMHGFSTVHIRSGLHSRTSLAVKRIFDLVIATVALIALAPVMVMAALAVKAGSSGPVFYKQRRLGRSGQQFEMIKFRSMVVNADQLLVDLIDENEADGPLFKMKNDPRITRVGGIMRRTSIDELPQLWNVLRGQMSLVGPRPALAIEADSWPIELFDRLEVSPGITGLWQVKGRSDASFADYERLDLYYVDNWTLGLDVAILARTIPALLGRGAY